MCKLGDIIVIKNEGYIVVDYINNELYTIEYNDFVDYLRNEAKKAKIIKFAKNENYFIFGTIDRDLLFDLIHFKENNI